MTLKKNNVLNSILFNKYNRMKYTNQKLYHFMLKKVLVIVFFFFFLNMVLKIKKHQKRVDTIRCYHNIYKIKKK